MSNIKLNPEAKAKWVAALRSGKYKQGKHMLKTPNNEFCCLGVAQDVFDPDSMVSTSVCSNGMPTSNVCNLLGFQRLDGNDLGFLCPEVRICSVNALLFTHNDSYDCTFEQIADAIEEQL